MANKYLSNTGSNTSPFESPTTAATTLSGLLGANVLASGELIYVKGVAGNNHTESYGASVTFNSPSWATASNPLRLYCVDDFFTGSPPTSLVNSPASNIVTSGAFNITFNGSWRIHGVRFAPGNGGAFNANCLFDVEYGEIEKSSFDFSNSSTAFRFGYYGSATSTSSMIFVSNCSVRFRNAGNKLYFGKAKEINITNISFDASSVSVTNVFTISTGGVKNTTSNVNVSDSDFSTLTYTNLLEIPADSGGGQINFVRCKLRAGANVVSAHVEKMPRVRIMDCDSANTNIRYEVYDAGGVVRTSNTIYPAVDPATDGTTTYSHSITTSTLASNSLPMYSDWIERWADGGVSITPRIEVLVGADGGPALNNNELWIEVEYQSDSTSPLGSTLSTRGSKLGTPSTVPGGTVPWIGHGFTNPVTHSLSVDPITPNKSGFVRARVAFAKPSSTIYYDPQIRW
jgi:hypothetical protein